MNKILVVDDDIDILSVVEILLKMNSYAVKAISKWEAIAHTVRSFLPDLILLDVSLGGGADGRQICTELKLSNDTQSIPVILFSAHYDLVNDIRGSMADGLVTKPFESPFLLETIRKNIS